MRLREPSDPCRVLFSGGLFADSQSVFPLWTLETIISFKLTTLITEFSSVWGQSPEAEGGFQNIQEHKNTLCKQSKYPAWMQGTSGGSSSCCHTHDHSAHLWNGSAEQKIFQTKILMWMHSLYGQNILPEVPSPSLPPPRSSSLQALLSLQEVPGEQGVKAVRTTLPAVSPEGQVKGKADWAAWS